MTDNRRFAIISLGCAKNRIDSEEIISLLLKNGYILTGNFKKADIIIVNTCAFIADAREESLKTIIKVSQYKKNYSCRLLVVLGCLAEIDKEIVLKVFPSVDLVIGVHSYENIDKTINKTLINPIRAVLSRKPVNKVFSGGDRFLTTAPHSVYLKIAEGCNNRCTYCLIPLIRGNYRSRSIDSIISESVALVQKGAREINLVAQDTTYYGMEGGGKSKLVTLLKEMIKIPQLKRIRILYAHPAHINDDLINLIASENSICSYIDLPIQHISEKILASMGRHYSAARIIRLLNRLRSLNIAVRSTLIVGFPGESDEDFRELMQFIRDYPFDRLGVFCYSAEVKTPAYLLKNHLEPELKEIRFNALMALQKKISFNLNRKKIGNNFDVLVDKAEKVTGDKIFYRGRTEREAPEIDGSVLFSAKESNLIGKFVKVRITGAGYYDLLGETIQG